MDVVSGGSDIHSCRSSGNEHCLIMCEAIMVVKGLMYMVKSVGPIAEH